MGKDSKIEWTTHTFNPWWGCEKISPACAHCYAETWAKRCGADVWGAKADRRVFGDKHWNEPLKWDAKAKAQGVRERVFCASMADVFEGRQDLQPERERLWNLIDQTQNLDWLLLTKRPEKVQRMLPSRWLTQGLPDHIWLGTTVENQAMAEVRIPALLSIEANVRFLSCEPLLEAVDLASVNYCANCFERAVPGTANDGTPWCSECDTEMCGYVLDPLNNINWVICGGESGAGEKTRPMHPDWARGLRDQCAAAEVPFLFKQWGDWGPWPTLPMDEELRAKFENAPFGEFHLGDGKWIRDCMCSEGNGSLYRVGKANAGRLLDGVEHNGFPEIEGRAE